MIKDSGERREFSTGGVRDIQIGKGRCDLMPLDIASKLLYGDRLLEYVDHFVRHRNITSLFLAMSELCFQLSWDLPTALLEVAKHYEEGSQKYAERNWEKGIPLHCYIDSSIRHYLKWKRGDRDESHDRAALWNLMCAAWTFEHLPEMDDLPQ